MGDGLVGHEGRVLRIAHEVMDFFFFVFSRHWYHVGILMEKLQIIDSDFHRKIEGETSAGYDRGGG